MENKNEWLLESLSIHKTWDNKNPYRGTIKFNSSNEIQFCLTLDHAKCAKLIAILKDEVVDSAKLLSEMMVNSMPVAISESTNEKSLND